MAAIVIDGQQSNAFVSSLANLQGFGLSTDASAYQFLPSAYGTLANNVSIYDWYDRRRRELNQDLDEGVLMWVNAAGRGVVDPNNRNGTQYLNCYSDGYPAASHNYSVVATGSVCTPRVELFLVSKNRAGLAVGS